MNDNIKYPVGVDLPVLLIFFNRPDTFEKVFEAVRKARPSKLFLACDGPREGRDDDVKKINECKKIAADIDWECEVYTDYSEKNLGCGIRPQSAITNAFKKTDRLVILEDDCVPHESFFPYMAELLEKYKDDERIGMISGLNHFKEWDCGGYSYCFTQTGAIWGWATWERVWKDYDYSVKEIDSPHVQKLMCNNITLKRAKKKKIQSFINARQRILNGENISFWDFQFGFLKAIKGYLSIVPRINLICNIGVGESSTHAQKNVSSSWKKGMLHFIPTANIGLPLVHPNFIICDHDYDDAVDAKWGYPNPFLRQFNRGIRLMKKLFKIGA